MHDNIPLRCQEDGLWGCGPLVQFLCKIKFFLLLLQLLITISFDFLGFVKNKILGVVECGAHSCAIHIFLFSLQFSSFFFFFGVFRFELTINSQ